MRKRAAFITIGQAPRPDIMDEMRPAWDDQLDIEEHGALDGLTPAEVEELSPAREETPLVSRLANGSEVILRDEAIHARIEALVARLDDVDLDFLVLLCTGRFDRLRSRHLVVKAQTVVDNGVDALRASTSRVGVLVPDEAQRDQHGGLSSHASPYSADRFDEAARELAGADLIVLHCMGYTGEHKRRVAASSGKPVLLAREMVATTVSWLAA